MRVREPGHIWPRGDRFKRSLLLSVFAITLVPGVQAQSTDKDGREYLQEIIVTARKRAERAIEVPISMSVIGGAELVARGVNNTRDLEFAVPNLAVTGVDTSMNPGFSLRGISSDARNVGFESGLSLYVDGVYTGRPSSFNQDMLDVERIEVLRGPQGTLFGKNTTAGAINIITAKPTDTPTGNAELQIGNYDMVRARASVSGPLVEGKVQARIGVFHRERDGYQTNLYDDSDIFTEDATGGQAKLAFQPNERLSLTLAADLLSEKYRPNVNEMTPGSFGATGVPRQVDIDADVFQKREIRAGSLNAEYDLGAATLTSISAYRTTDTSFLSDDDGSRQPYLTSAFADDQSQFSQELRVGGTTGALTYVIGAYYLDQSASSGRNSTIPPGTLLGPIGVTVALDANVDTESYAGFGQADYALTDKVKLTAGLRYTHEKKDVDMDLIGSPLFGITTLKTRQSRSDESLSPSAALSYQPTPDVNLYAKVTHGFKAGGFNADYVANNQIGFAPEKVLAYEAGLKMVSRPAGVRLDLAAFRMNYDDLQVMRFQTFGGFTISNAASATIQGVEADLSYSPIAPLTLTASAGYLDATFDAFPNGGGAGVDYDGNHLPSAPKWTTSLAGEYRVPVADRTDLSLRVEYTYRAALFVDADNAAASRLPGFGLFNARLRMDFDDGRWAAEIWGKNLGDKLYVNDTGGTPLSGLLGQQTISYGTPRTYGLRLAARF